MKKLTAILLIVAMMLTLGACSKRSDDATGPVSYTHLTLPTNREV